MNEVWELTDEHYEQAAKLGLSKNLVYKRVEYGWTIEKAITTPKQRRDPVRSKYRKLAKENGISENAFQQRLVRGWSYQRAATEPLVKVENSRTDYEKMAEENGISLKTFRSRVYYGWDMEKAATTPVTDRGQQKARNRGKRILSKELTDTARRNGISLSAAYKRIHMGWDPERAVTEPTKTNRGKERELA